MRIFLKIAAILLVSFTLLLSSWFVLQGDIYFHTDIARDFLLLEEIDQKKIVLIGPRASGNGLFHGPLWSYLNYPAYALGQGNPVVVGWYWIGLIAGFLALSFWVARKIFDEHAAAIYMILLSTAMVLHARALFNPHGALFIFPLFFYTLYRYAQTRKKSYLLWHGITGAIMIQFQMAVGVPFLFLSFFYVLLMVIRSRQWKDLFMFLIVPVFLSNFILFDVRHGFQMSKGLFAYASPQTEKGVYDYASMIDNRLAFGMNLQVLEFVNRHEVWIVFAIASLFLLVQWKDKKYRLFYGLSTYLYGGYMLLSFINKGGILYHQYFPTMAITLLLFASFITSRYKYVFLMVLVGILYLNIPRVIAFANGATGFVGLHEDSWKFLSSMTSDLYRTEDPEFGYFVYSPDAVGYEANYAMHYATRHSNKQVFPFQKKRVTYLVLAPPPAGNPYMKSQWWKEHGVHITKHPTYVKEYPNGYVVERYELTPEEIAVPFDPNINIGLHFR